MSPNLLTGISLAVALVAGVAFYLATPTALLLLLAAAFLVACNALLDAADGKLARLTGTATRRGDYLDHVTDRYADVALLFGITLNPAYLLEWEWGLLAIVGTLLTSYMGTQAQAVGVGRDYRGMLSRADRVTLLAALPLFQAILAFAGSPLVQGRSLVAWGVIAIAILGNATAIQRMVQGWRALGPD